MKKFLDKLIRVGRVEMVNPSENMFQSYLEKSFSNFDSAKILFENNKLEEVVALAYYSMYNLVLALLFKVGIKSENHSASIFLLKDIFEFDNKFILEAKEERIDKQYYVDFNISKQEVEKSLIVTENFNRDLKAFISGLGKSDIIFYRKIFGEKWGCSVKNS